MKKRCVSIAACLLAIAICGCDSPTPIPTPTPTATIPPSPWPSPSPTASATPTAASQATDGVIESTVEVLGVEIIATYPHDVSAYTQGLVWHDGLLYESTGRYLVTSTLREVDLLTGEVLRSFTLSDAYYAEGLALVDDRLIQITWKDQIAFVYDRQTFEQLGTFSYTGEGWGLCFDGSELYMSDGTNTITVRDPQTFEALRTISVTRDGVAVFLLNEIECVGDFIYANVWKTDEIIRIDKHTGLVTDVVIASGLLNPGEVTDGEAVLNGIAYNPEADTFYITGKMWPWLFEVRFHPVP